MPRESKRCRLWVDSIPPGADQASPLAPEDGLDGLEIHHLIHGKYRILFTMNADRIVILQVRHGARLPATED